VTEDKGSYSARDRQSAHCQCVVVQKYRDTLNGRKQSWTIKFRRFCRSVEDRDSECADNKPNSKRMVNTTTSSPLFSLRGACVWDFRVLVVCSLESSLNCAHMHCRSMAFLLVRSFTLAIVTSYHGCAITDRRPTMRRRCAELRTVGKLFARASFCYRYPYLPQRHLSCVCTTNR
jgi:hypothetical protein